jgi:hypothetical protein
VIVQFPSTWIIDDEIPNKFGVSVGSGNDYRGQYYFCAEMEKGFDTVFDAIECNVNKMLTAQERAKLFREKTQELQNLFEDESKTQTYKNCKLNKVSEIEIEKLTKLSKGAHQSPQYTHKSISRFSTDNTYSTKKIYNNIDDLEINPENYNIVKEFRINNLKWFLFKKINKNILSETEGIQPLYRRYQYLKLNSSRKKEKEKLNEDSYSNYIWKAYKEEKDFINFNLDNLEHIENEKDKKINELQMLIKELKENLKKKENDYNRINLNYAKLFKKAKKPEMTYDKLLEENERLKSENKLLNKKLEKMIETQNFIGISFIGDDLEGSNFIDDNAFENILEEITKNREDKKEQEITIFLIIFKINYY